MTKIQVPAGMLGAVEMYVNSQDGRGYAMPILEAALQWLSEHPIVPTDEQHKDIIAEWRSECREDQGYKAFVEEWQRRMFLAEPEVPAQVKDLLSKESLIASCGDALAEHDRRVLEGFRRGQRSKG